MWYAGVIFGSIYRIYTSYKKGNLVDCDCMNKTDNKSVGVYPFMCLFEQFHSSVQNSDKKQTKERKTADEQFKLR
jgi:hypothetical protein